MGIHYLISGQCSISGFPMIPKILKMDHWPDMGLNTIQITTVNEPSKLSVKTTPLKYESRFCNLEAVFFVSSAKQLLLKFLHNSE